MFTLCFFRDSKKIETFKISSEDIVELMFFNDIKNFNENDKINIDLTKFAFVVQDWKIAFRTFRELIQSGKTEPYFKSMLEKTRKNMKELGFKKLFLEHDFFDNIDYYKELELMLPYLCEKFSVDFISIS